MSKFVGTCTFCGGEVHKNYRPPKGNIFCNSSCAASFNNRGKRRGPRKQKRTCSECGGFSHSVRPDKPYICYVCKPRRERTSADWTLARAIGDRSGSVKYQRVRHHAFSLYKNHSTCQECGYNKHVEICHVRPISDFPLTATIGEINSSENIKILCPNCHWEMDHHCSTI